MDTFDLGRPYVLFARVRISDGWVREVIAVPNNRAGALQAKDPPRGYRHVQVPQDGLPPVHAGWTFKLGWFSSPPDDFGQSEHSIQVMEMFSPFSEGVPWP